MITRRKLATAALATGAAALTSASVAAATPDAVSPEFGGGEDPGFKAIYAAMRRFIDNPGSSDPTYGLAVAAALAIKDSKHGGQAAAQAFENAMGYHLRDDVSVGTRLRLWGWHDRDGWRKVSEYDEETYCLCEKIS